MYLSMVRKIKSNTIHVFIGLCVSLSLTSGLIIHFYINRMGYEVVNAWLESEAISIQEGSFVVGLSRFSRAILTSNVVTTITVFQIKLSKMTPIASYGEILSRVDLCKSVEHQLDVMTSCRVSLFHEVIVYRSSYRPDLVVAFDLQPRVAKFLFLLLTGLITIIAGVFVIAMKRVATAEHKNRLMLIKMAIDSLISNSKPSALLLSELPDLETNWNELTSKVESMKVELETSAREAEIGRITAQLTHDLRAPLGTIERLLFLDKDTTIRSRPSKSSLLAAPDFVRIW